MKKRFFVSTLLAFFVFASLVAPIATYAAESEVTPLVAPTILVPDEGFRAVVTKPLIRGVTKNDTKVTVYIDGMYSGHARVENGTSGTATFAYTPSVHLKPGFHTVQAYAERTRDSVKSVYSKPIRFEVERPYPAPMLFQPVVNASTISTQPYITGLVFNNSLVKVFIDGKQDGEFWVRKDIKVAIVDFAYKPAHPLDPKKGHLVYATATDVHGKVSGYSNPVGFFVRAPKPKAVATTGTNMSSATNSSQNTTQSTGTPADTNSSSTNNSNPSSSNSNTNSNANTNSSANTNSNVNDSAPLTTNTNEATNANESTTQPDPNQTSDRSWILWAIVVVMVLVILFRNRGEIQKSLMGEDEQMKASEEAVKDITSTSESQSTEKKDEKNSSSDSKS